MAEDRYIKVCSKLLGINIDETKSLLMQVKDSRYSIETAANMFQRVYKQALQNQSDLAHEQASRKRLNSFAITHKDRIIELYLDNEDGPGLGYAAIRKYFIARCKSTMERKAVISDKTFAKYLHDVWEIPKDQSRRNPKASVVKSDDLFE